MPALSLVVCVRDERDLLQRLLQKAEGCYDEVIVVHDGPDTVGVRELVNRVQGRFFERPRQYQQEPHWPFAWQQAAHDWVLRLDADEFPGEDMRGWLVGFRSAGEPGEGCSGYTCIWPLWNGRRTVTRHWPAGRIFLFHRQRVRFFGMAEQVPVPDFQYEPLQLVLEHRPRRKSYGMRNILLRKQAYRWRSLIAQSLLSKPTDRPCWRWDSGDWPEIWEQIRRRPLRTALRRLTRDTLVTLREQWRIEGRIHPTAVLSGPLHHALIALAYSRLRRSQARGQLDSARKWTFDD